MQYSTKTSLLEKLTNILKINQKFHKTQKDKINQDNSIIISPVQATLTHIGKITKDGNLISKFNRTLNVQETLGKNAKLFSNGFYMNFYLSPKDKHYWRTPYQGKLISTKIKNGKSKIPIIVGLERFFPKINFFEKAIKENATISSIFQTKQFPYAMIAIGSLNVNSIHTVNQDYFQKQDVAGYFNLGSSILLCFPNYSLNPIIKPKTKVDIGEAIIQIKN